MKKINDGYIRNRFGKKLPQNNVDNIKRAMQKYGDNFWWESKDPLQIAMYQIFEPILLTDFSEFHKGLEQLLDRPVWTHEMGINYDGLKEEARLGIKRLKQGLKISDEQRAEAIKRSIASLEDFCKRTGKTLFKLETSGDKKGIDTSGYEGWLKSE